MRGGELGELEECLYKSAHADAGAQCLQLGARNEPCSHCTISVCMLGLLQESIVGNCVYGSDGSYSFTTEGGRELTFTESPATIGTRVSEKGNDERERKKREREREREKREERERRNLDLGHLRVHVKILGNGMVCRSFLFALRVIVQASCIGVRRRLLARRCWSLAAAAGCWAVCWQRWGHMSPSPTWPSFRTTSPPTYRGSSLKGNHAQHEGESTCEGESSVKKKAREHAHRKSAAGGVVDVQVLDWSNPLFLVLSNCGVF